MTESQSHDPLRDKLSSGASGEPQDPAQSGGEQSSAGSSFEDPEAAVGGADAVPDKTTGINVEGQDAQTDAGFDDRD